jgi:hypothetical protein
MLHIEKSAFRRGEYVAYFNGAWRVYRSEYGWCAVKADTSPFIICARTLKEVDDRFAAMHAASV